MIRVIVVDDQELIRQGIQLLLSADPEIQVVGQATNGHQALTLVERLQPDVVLMDIRMPEMDGVEATRRIKLSYPQIAVIVLTTFDDDEYLIEGLRAGARGYLLKDVTIQEIADAIRTVMRGDALIHPSMTAKLLNQLPHFKVDEPAPAPSPQTSLLTGRELDVLRLLAEGRSNAQIADQLTITEGTVKNHVSNILDKLQARDRTHAVVLAQRMGLINLP